MDKREFMKMIPKRIDKDIRERINNRAFNDSRYIFIRKEGERSIGYCTSCKKEYELYGTHNNYTSCKRCNCSAQIKLERYGRKCLIDNRVVLIFQKPLKDAEGVVARGFFCTRDYSGDYKETKTKFMEVAIYLFENNGSTNMYANLGSWWYCRDFEKDRRETMHITKSVYDFNINGLSSFKYWKDMEGFNEAIEGTRLKYANDSRVSRYKLMSYLELYNKYPIIESLDKVGFKNIVNEKLKGNSMMRQVNLKAKTITEALGLNKGQIREIRESGVEISVSFLKYYKKNIAEGWGFSIEEVMNTERIIENGYRACEILKHVSVKEMYRYVAKQFEKREEFQSMKDVVYTWADYFRDCEKLGINIERNRFPKDIHMEHLKLTKQIKYMHDKEIAEKIKNNREKRKNLAFSYRGLFIRPAETVEEIIQEGKDMEHCVGGYAKSHADMKTNILFIRKQDEPTKAYVTVEISSEMTVVQVRGKQNANPPEEVNVFIKAYEEKVLKTLRNKKSKNKKYIA